MILHKMAADYDHLKYLILIMVLVLFASATAACQPNQITPTEEPVEPTDFPPNPGPRPLRSMFGRRGTLGHIGIQRTGLQSTHLRWWGALPG